jgi:hypothetical protein
VNPEPKPCPHCGQNAPIVHRGVLTYCTGCGRPRAPFSASNVTLAGRPSKVGGAIASVAGWVVIGVGIMVALAIGLLLQAIFPGAPASWGIGGMIAVASIGVGLALVLSGRSLSHIGTRAAQDVREQAITALATNQGGRVTARDAALALGISVQEADAVLAEMAKTGDDVVLEVNDQGGLFYRFAQILPETQMRWPADGTRIEGARETDEPAPAGGEPVTADEEPAAGARQKAR